MLPRGAISDRRPGGGRVRSLAIVAPPDDSYAGVTVIARRNPTAPEPPLLQSLLVPMSVVTVFLLLYWAHWPFWAATAGSLPFVVLLMAAPDWARSSLRRFDRDMVVLLSIERSASLGERLRRAVGMRLFAPPALVAERRAMCLAEVGDHARALAWYKRSMAGWGDAEAAPVAVYLGAAHAALALGRDAEAEGLFRSVVARDADLPRVRRKLAQALLRQGRDADEARRLLEDAGRATADPLELRLVAALDAWALAAGGDRSGARAALERLAVEPVPSADSSDATSSDVTASATTSGATADDRLGQITAALAAAHELLA